MKVAESIDRRSRIPGTPQSHRSPRSSKLTDITELKVPEVAAPLQVLAALEVLRDIEVTDVAKLHWVHTILNSFYKFRTIKL